MRGVAGSTLRGAPENSFGLLVEVAWAGLALSGGSRGVPLGRGRGGTLGGFDVTGGEPGGREGPPAVWTQASARPSWPARSSAAAAAVARGHAEIEVTRRR